MPLINTNYRMVLPRVCSGRFELHGLMHILYPKDTSLKYYDNSLFEFSI